MGRRGRKRKQKVSTAPETMQEPTASSKIPRCGDGGTNTATIGLTAEEIAQFKDKGFVLLKRTFSPMVASACRDFLWKRLGSEGILKDDESTWVERKGIAECYGPRLGSPWSEVFTPRLQCALGQLCGRDRWQRFGCGWWVINFPNFHKPPWGAAGHWHIDGAHYQHHVNSKQSGLLPIFLFSTTKGHCGGTALCEGSHKTAARILFENEPYGMKGSDLSNETFNRLPKPLVIEEVQGEAGDVMLTHPFLLHARSKNLGTERVDSVRFMCNPNVALKKPMRFDTKGYSHVAKTMLSPVEQAIVEA